MDDHAERTGRRTAGANVHALRDHNRALVMDVIRSGQAVSRVELAEQTGLTAQAVSKIVAGLIELGLVAEGGQSPHGVGKPRTILRLVAAARFALGAQFDRDGLRLVLVDLAGSVVARWARRFDRPPTPRGVLDGLAVGCTELLRGKDIPRGAMVGLGVGVPGPLDHDTGVVRDATSLPGWHDIPLRDLASERTGLPVIVDKDTNVAVVAERWRRPRELRDAALVYVGTGIGAGLLLGGEVHRGSRTNAGEFGHTTLQADGPRCACGRRGCVEVLCGPIAVLRRVTAARANRNEAPAPIDHPPLAPTAPGQTGLDQTGLDQTGLDQTALDQTAFDQTGLEHDGPTSWEPSALSRFVDLCRDADAGDAVAAAELARAGRLLGVAVVDLVQLLDLDQVIFGGGAFQAAQGYFRPAVVRALTEQLPRPDWQRVTVRHSDLGADLVPAGAGMLMLSASYGLQPFGRVACSVPPNGLVSAP